MHFLRKNAFLRPHAADAYKTNGILIQMEPFLAQKRFQTKKCISGTKIDFWAQSAKNCPEMHFWAQKCTFRKSDQKVNVRLDLPEGEQGFPDSSPDSIHGRPGLLKHVAFSVPLHSNKAIRSTHHHWVLRTLFAGRMTCLETPDTGEPDIDLYAGDEATGTEDVAIGTATSNSAALLNAGDDWKGGLTAKQ